MVGQIRERMAWNITLAFCLIAAQSLNQVVGCLQIHVRDDDDMRAGTTFDIGQITALFIQQKCADRQRYLNANDRAAFFQGFLFHHAQNRQGQRACVPNTALAIAAWT